ncbi:MAG: hypothetical protein JXB10_05110, partial [Pirellulales bacterium]|nr:hypothetical protein [Pirellulales bacterium]
PAQPSVSTGEKKATDETPAHANPFAETPAQPSVSTGEKKSAAEPPAGDNPFAEPLEPEVPEKTPADSTPSPNPFE